MDITVYLPDALGKRAKAEGLNLSRMLRDALTEEFERRNIMKGTLEDTEVFEVDVEDDDGRVYEGRITGARIAYSDHSDVTVFLTDDERVILYDGDRMKFWELANAEEELRERIDPATYAEAMHALGIKPVIDI